MKSFILVLLFAVAYVSFANEVKVKEATIKQINQGEVTGAGGQAK